KTLDVRVVAYGAVDEPALLLPRELLAGGKPAFEAMSVRAAELEDDHVANASSPLCAGSAGHGAARRPGRRSHRARLGAVDAPHLVLHRHDGTHDDRAEAEDRADGQRRNAGQALAYRTSERRDAAEPHQYRT